MLVTVQRVMLATIIGLVPMLAYCLLLVGLNGRRRATMVPGTWDFAGALLATSGFVLGGGPLILAGLNAGWRRLLLRGHFADWRSMSGEGNVIALASWALYFALVVAGAAILIARRRSYTVFYNVDVPHFPDALQWVFGRLGVVWKRTERGYDLQKSLDPMSSPWRPGSLPVRANAASLSDAKLRAGGPVAATLLVHPLPGSCNVTLQWSGEYGDLRRLVEGEMNHLLPNLRPEHNPASAAFLIAATILFGLIAAGIVFVAITSVRLRGVIGGL
jgi:hypothetical protein